MTLIIQTGLAKWFTLVQMSAHAHAPPDPPSASNLGGFETQAVVEDGRLVKTDLLSSCIGRAIHGRGDNGNHSNRFIVLAQSR